MLKSQGVGHGDMGVLGFSDPSNKFHYKNFNTVFNYLSKWKQLYHPLFDLVFIYSNFQNI